MTSKLSQSDSCRFGGCTLTGALSATTHIRDTVSVVHGPKGCTHHNFSLLQATGSENDRVAIPDLISTNLAETDIVFGGERVLVATLESTARNDIRAIFVLSTCIIDTIGDDVAAVCEQEYGIPVIRVPTAGFLGGTFQGGLNNALCAIAGLANPCVKHLSVNIIGEKNLEYEVEENYGEVARLLSLLGIPVNLRYVRNCELDRIGRLGAARLNVLRDQDLVPTGEFLKQRFGTPYLVSYPTGFDGTIRFLEAVATLCGTESGEALFAEQARQDKTIADFGDLSGEKVRFALPGTSPESFRVAGEMAQKLDLSVGPGGREVPVPFDPPVGSTGIRRLLHRWRCAIHA